MGTAIIRPTGYAAYRYVSNIENLYDNDTNTKITSSNDVYSCVILNNFDTSSIPPAVAEGGKIKNIKLCITADPTGNAVKFRIVRNATTISDYVDCGDGSITWFTSGDKADYEIANFPVATEYWNTNISSFLNGDIQVRLYGLHSKEYIYEVFLEVEYELPTITVTIEVSPAKGGTVIGGGTYESGSAVTLTATPNSGYLFSHWQIGETVVGTENPISGPLTTNATVTAVFIEKPSKVYCGTKKCSVYVGTKKCSVYCGTVKIT